MLTVRQFVLAAAVVMLLAGAGSAQGAPAAKGLSLSPSAIQINPKRPNIVYASTLGDDTHEGGVIKSTDAGKTWNLADTGLTNPASPTDSEDLRVDALALDPRSPNVLYAGTGLGVFKTTDGAKTWKLASTGIDFGGDGLSVTECSKASCTRSRSTLCTRDALCGRQRRLEEHERRRYLEARPPNTRSQSRYRTAPARDRLRQRDQAPSGQGDPQLDLQDDRRGGSWRPTGPTGLDDNFFGHPIVVDRHRVRG